MELAEFTPISKRIAEGKEIDVRFEEGTGFSLPVALRRDSAQYDAMFLFEKPKDGRTASPRPHAWMLMDAYSGRVALHCRCDLVDFMPAGRFPVGEEIPMAELKAAGKKRAAMTERLLGAYEEIRGFVFEEPLSRPQAAAVTTYKELFEKLIYPSHYPYYHALSPAFFHWMRMPLPKEALMDPSRPMSELRSDGYQLLILENLQQLVRQFQDKISTDTHKQKLFDSMHEELQGYKNGLLDSLTLSLERDIIQVIDGVIKTVEIFREKEGSPEDYRRLFAMLEGVETDLTDLLYRHGVDPYTSAEVDVHRQKIIQTIPTADPALDKTIAGRLASGWEKGDRIIRPERVSVYVYEAGRPDPRPADQTSPEREEAAYE